ncbi:MAG: prepilin-type N-terminal cleavage/methylation domain-containing protein [Candidatus Moraniibacteriota bacterium]
MRTSSKNSRGFSLLEVLLATFIFSIIMVGVTSYFVSITVANQNTKRLQQNLEDIQFTMNRVAKSLRTSVFISSPSSHSSQEIRVFDYSQSLFLRYKF